MKTAYATRRTPDIQGAIKETFGAGALVAGIPNVDLSRADACWPFDPATHEVVGRAAAHRSGPFFAVVATRRVAS